MLRTSTSTWQGSQVSACPCTSSKNSLLEDGVQNMCEDIVCALDSIMKATEEQYKGGLYLIYEKSCTNTYGFQIATSLALQLCNIRKLHPGNSHMLRKLCKTAQYYKMLFDMYPEVCTASLVKPQPGIEDPNKYLTSL